MIESKLQFISLAVYYDLIFFLDTSFELFEYTGRIMTRIQWFYAAVFLQVSDMIEYKAFILMSMSPALGTIMYNHSCPALSFKTWRSKFYYVTQWSMLASGVSTCRFCWTISGCQAWEYPDNAQLAISKPASI